MSDLETEGWTVRAVGLSGVTGQRERVLPEWRGVGRNISHSTGETGDTG